MTEDTEIRQPIVTVLGHVDSGKTTLLDRIRESSVSEEEPGKITQMIGSTEVPKNTLQDISGKIMEKMGTQIQIPGLMFIDTPGHAAFSSLRSRGGTISDITILVVDIKDGIQKQTLEALQILGETETPFIVAANKVDTINGWKDNRHVTENIKSLPQQTIQRLDQNIYEIIGELHDEGFTADRFDRIDNFQEKIAVVPISAKTGEGIPELISVVTGLTQNYLEGDLKIEEDQNGQGTIIEVSEKKGLGQTIDVVQHNGTFKKGDRLVYGTMSGTKKTKIKAIFKGNKLTDSKNQDEFNEITQSKPAAGIKISGTNLEDAVPGTPVISCPGETQEAERKIQNQVQSQKIDVQEHGVVVKADSLGSLEAVSNQLKDIDVNIQKAAVGEVNKNDVALAEDEEGENRAIITYNTKIPLNPDVQIFSSQIVHELVEQFKGWRTQLEEERRKQKMQSTVRPAEIRILPDHNFRKSNPLVSGVEIKRGVLKPGAQIINSDGERIGKVKSIQEEGEKVEKASKGDRAAVSIQGPTLGRQVTEGETLYSDIKSEDYKTLNDLSDMMPDDEQKTLNKIVEIKNSVDPHWRL